MTDAPPRRPDVSEPRGSPEAGVSETPQSGHTALAVVNPNGHYSEAYGLRFNGGVWSLRRSRYVGRRRRFEDVARFGRERPVFHRPVVLLGDARELLKELPNHTVQLAVTSPPYFMLKESPWDGFEAYLSYLDPVWIECLRVLDFGAHLVVNIGDQNGSMDGAPHRLWPCGIEVAHRILQAGRRDGLVLVADLVWDKIANATAGGSSQIMGGSAPPNMLYSTSYEHIFVFRKNGRRNRNPSAEERKASKVSRAFRLETYAAIWRLQGAKRDLHSAPFPVALPARFILRHTFVGDTVLDPFAGSGTTLLAAARLARRSIGVELRPEYARAIPGRLDPLQRLFARSEP